MTYNHYLRKRRKRIHHHPLVLPLQIYRQETLTAMLNEIRRELEERNLLLTTNAILRPEQPQKGSETDQREGFSLHNRLPTNETATTLPLTTNSAPFNHNHHGLEATFKNYQDYITKATLFDTWLAKLQAEPLTPTNIKEQAAKLMRAITLRCNRILAPLINELEELRELQTATEEEKEKIEKGTQIHTQSPSL